MAIAKWERFESVRHCHYSQGVVWYSESGVNPNTLVRFDPTTKSFSSTPIPSGGGVVRNIAATKDGRLYLACSGVNKVAIVEVY